jgi:RNA polymerase sigma-70 factor (sigma-E family)
VALTSATPRVDHTDFVLDADVMTAVVDEQWTSLIRLAVLLLGDRAAAEDAVQDACEATWRRHPQLHDREHLIGYLRRAVVNRCHSTGRRTGTVRRFLASVRADDTPTAPAADVPVLTAEADAELLAALARLTARQREVLVLRYWSELSERQIAETLGIAPGTVKSTASAALARLNTLLGDLR